MPTRRALQPASPGCPTHSRARRCRPFHLSRIPSWPPPCCVRWYWPLPTPPSLFRHSRSHGWRGYWRFAPWRYPVWIGVPTRYWPMQTHRCCAPDRPGCRTRSNGCFSPLFARTIGYWPSCGLFYRPTPQRPMQHGLYHPWRSHSGHGCLHSPRGCLAFGRRLPAHCWLRPSNPRC